MAIIDERGRVFGRVNLFDLVIGAILIFSVFFMYKFFWISENPKTVKKYSEGHAFIEVTAKNIMPEVAGLIHEGDIVKDENGRVALEVTSILANDPAVLGNVSLPDGSTITVFGEPNRDVRLLLRIMCFKRYGRPIANINSVYLVIGAPFSFMAEKYVLTGALTKIGEVNETR